MLLYGIFLLIFVFVVIYQLDTKETYKQRLVGQNIQDIYFLYPSKYFDYAADPNGNLDQFDYYVSNMNISYFCNIF